MNVESKRILVVEYDACLLSLISKIIMCKGYEVSTAATGEEALTKLRTEPVNLVVSDTRMEPSGLEILKAAYSQNVPAIMMTGYHTEAIEQKCLANGAFTFIPMPFKIDDLLHTVHRALQNPKRKDVPC